MLSVVVLMMMSIILILFAFFDDQERASNSLAYGKQLLTSAARSTFGGGPDEWVRVYYSQHGPERSLLLSKLDGNKYDRLYNALVPEV
ncbi:unnamed protein product [Heligmosomoides polygyrus]|uniref:T2SSG domain-containing protein n=1 Tax=Heligmosomoides polygyrus TaxID=6339 RepID=A0A183GIU5_HELPZ|nr:unnamed protein product [Heligmosomoides polygyrus]